MNERDYNELNFESIQIGLASPETIMGSAEEGKGWSYGEVTKAETINYRSLKPEADGLYCERIFGPQKDWECHCGKYKRIRYKGITCRSCGVKVTKSKVRRERMGHIKLACAVSHIWYLKTIPSKMALILDMSPKQLEQVLYFAENVVLDPGATPLVAGTVLSEKQYMEYREMYEDEFRVGMGAAAIKELLANIDVEALALELKNELITATGQKKARLIKRLEVVESFRKSGNKLEWMILDTIPVLPPDIRPMVQLDGGRFASSDLNELYRRVISRNNRLKKLLETKTPEIVVRNEKRMLQEAVDALIDNGRHGKAVTGSSNRAYKSLSEMLRGKQGRFRQNLLGKRVDYSGRSVIVVGPSLKIYQCGLPREMALELFKPFVVKRLTEMGKATNVKDAQKKIERVHPDVWDALENVIKEHPVLLNRAPTLHRLSIQAFEPVLVEGRAIKLHPLVCTAFNADFDGDQMPVHVPLSAEAQAEARFLMLSANNLLKPMDGRAVATPTQDMILGSYYLTMMKEGEPGEGSVFKDYDEAVMAYENGVIGLHSKIKVRVEKEIDGVIKSKVIDTTLGRLIFNKPLPQDLGFVDRSNPDNQFKLEIEFVVKKKQLGQIIDYCIKKHGSAVCANMLDEIKAMGYKYSTRASFSISVYDMTIPSEKKDHLAQAQKDVDKISKHFMRGELSEEERYTSVIRIWNDTTEKVTEALNASFSTYNPIKIMADSGARGSMTQMRQLAGMRGLMFSATGKTMEIPIKSNFREGLNITEYFMGARSSRKSLSDTALRTADSGYLTRRLVDVAQEVIIREEKCDTTKGAWVNEILDDKNVLEPLQDRIVGRYTMGPVIHPETGEVIVDDDVMISDEMADKIVKAGIDKVYIRTVIQCHAKYGICAHCYGADLASGKPVNIGEAVGIIAAQSIGEPGTQLTMRTFHSGGVAGSDITQGLPRVEELFEARQPKRAAIMAEQAGTVHVQPGDIPGMNVLTIHADNANGEFTTQDYKKIDVPYGTRLAINDGDHVEVGDALTEGNKAPADIMRILGLDAVYEYVIKETQKVYRSQSCNVNDKHIEIIARQMTRKIRVEDSGDTDMLLGAMVDMVDFEEENNKIKARVAAGEEELKEAVGTPVLLGITKASLQTESFLSAASFQETTRVLTEAAIRGKVDNLLGLKENVIIGKLIPAGTGMGCYHNIDVSKADDPETDPEGNGIVADVDSQETPADSEAV